MADGWGGARPGSGRKKKLTTIIKEKAIKEAGEDAKYALGLFVGYMRDENLEPKFRAECAAIVMDRVWGKARQQLDATIATNVNIYLPDNGRD